MDLLYIFLETGESNMKQMLLCCLIVGLITPVFSAINTDEIERLRQRTEKSSELLSASDKAAIEKFWKNAITAIVLTEDAQEVVEIRRQIEAQRGTEPLSDYTQVFIKEAITNLETAFKNIQGLQDPERKLIAERNLMILTANMKSTKLAAVALARINSDDTVVRYWGIKAVTQPAVIQELTSDIIPLDSVLLDKILTALNEIAGDQTPEVQRMIINFTAAVNHDIARQILLKIADQRIQAYMSWSVRNEIVDVRLLSALGNIANMQTDAGVRSRFGQKFAILYSVIIQRYMKYTSDLTDEQLDNIKTVIAEIAQNILDRTMDIKTRIIDLMRRNGELDREYEAVFGDRLRAGELAARYGFDYGKDASGKAITEPPTLGPPPAATALEQP